MSKKITLLLITTKCKLLKIMANYFHYTSGKGLFGILSSDTLQCTNIKYLNDPSENIYIDSLLEEIFKDNPAYKDIYNKLINSSIEDGVYHFTNYVASFSKRQDSLHMWNYYASGNGYNIGINLDSVREKNINKFDFINKEDVIYDITIQKGLLIDLFEKYTTELLKFEVEYEEFNNNEELDYLYSGELLQIQLDFHSDIRKYRFQFKHMAYRHEDETRLIIGCDYTGTNDKLRYKVTDSGVIIEYIELDLNLKKNLKSITIHPAANELHLLGVKDYISSKFSSVGMKKIRQSKVPFRII